jgi:hypothetical protein
MGMRYSTEGVREADIFKNSQPLYCATMFLSFWQSNIPVSCSQQQITDRHAEPQEHSSHRYNKRGLRHKNVTEDESS